MDHAFLALLHALLRSVVCNHLLTGVRLASLVSGMYMGAVFHIVTRGLSWIHFIIGSV